MSEWWTYRPSDFLMYSPRIYWRLFESLNDAWWPAQLIQVGAPLTWIAARWRRARGTMRMAAPAMFVGCAWALVAWAFLHQRFAPINWIADGYAIAFGIAAGALMLIALRAKSADDLADRRSTIALALALWGLLGQPITAVLGGRSWTQAEVFGLAPDPTVIATLGFLLVVDGASAVARAARWVVLAIAFAWCVLSTATLATMGSLHALAPLAAALLALLGLRMGRSTSG